MVSATDYIDDLLARGRSTFITDEAVKALDVSLPAVRAAVRRLKEKRVVAVP